MITDTLNTHVHDQARLAALRETALLDSPTEVAFDRLSRFATRILDAPVALVTLIDADRQFFKSCIGLPEPWNSQRETPLSHSFCQHNNIVGRPLIIDDARTHPIFKDNPAIRDLKVIAYLGIPLATPDGYVLGSFCVIDSHPRHWSDREVDIMIDLSGAVMSEIQLRTEMRARSKAEGDRDYLVGLNARLHDEIAARKQAEESLRHNTEFNRRVADVLPLVLYVLELPSARNIYINHEVGNDLGYTPEQVKAMGREFVPRNIHPDDLSGFENHLRDLRSLPRGTIKTFEYRMRSANGDWHWFLSRDTVFKWTGNDKPLHILGTATDITEQKRTEAALRESEELYRRYFDSTPYALFLGDPYKLSNPNPSAKALFGCSAEELNSSRPEDFSPEFQPDGTPSREKATWYIEEALAGCPQFFEWKSRKRDGTQFDSEVSLIRVDQHDEPQLMTTIRDVTERKRAKENLIASLREKETLLQEIYHRTKNNMQVIASLLELQASSSGSPEVGRIIEDSTSRIRTMSLAHEKLYSAKSLSRINMKEYISELAEHIRAGSELAPDQVELRFDLREIEMLIDLAVPCGLIINELLSNSLKHAFPGGRKGWILLSLRRGEDGLIEIEIRDNGVGLPPGFDILDTTSLGVQLVRRIAGHQLRGEITSEENNGLCWCLRFRDDLYSERVQR